MSEVRANIVSDKEGTGNPKIVGGAQPTVTRIDYNQVANADRESVNISSVNDTSAGQFQLNFTNPFPDIYYRPMYTGMEDFRDRGMTFSYPTTGSYGNGHKFTTDMDGRSELQNNNPVDNRVNCITIVDEAL